MSAPLQNHVCRTIIQLVTGHPRITSITLFILLAGCGTLLNHAGHSPPTPASLVRMETILQSSPRVVRDPNGDRTVELVFNATSGFRLGYIRHIDFLWNSRTLPPELQSLKAGATVILGLQPRRRDGHEDKYDSGRVWELRTPDHAVLTFAQTLHGARNACRLSLMLKLLLAGLCSLGMFIVLQYLKPRPAPSMQEQA